jgi:Protein of unknown function (DUF2946)
MPNEKMEDIVKAALAKWPKVPACYGWLGLDARGQWWMRDDRAQGLGAFTSGVPGAKGSQLKHDKLIAFIHRNYEVLSEGPGAGQWFFQNGPQRVYVELQATPLIWRVQADFSITAHTGAQARAQRCVLDEHGRVYLDADIGFGLVHTQDVYLAAEAIEQGLWVPEEVPTRELPTRFGYVRSPQSLSNK